MKKYLLLILVAQFSFGQAGAPAAPYYNGFNWSQTGMTLKASLSALTISKHSIFLTYAEAENALRFTDLDTDDATNTNLLLLYCFQFYLLLVIDLVSNYVPFFPPKNYSYK